MDTWHIPEWHTRLIPPTQTERWWSPSMPAVPKKDKVPPLGLHFLLAFRPPCQVHWDEAHRPDTENKVRLFDSWLTDMDSGLAVWPPPRLLMATMATGPLNSDDVLWLLIGAGWSGSIPLVQRRNLEVDPAYYCFWLEAAVDPHLCVMVRTRLKFSLSLGGTWIDLRPPVPSQWNPPAHRSPSRP